MAHRHRTGDSGDVDGSRRTTQGAVGVMACAALMAPGYPGPIDAQRFADPTAHVERSLTGAATAALPIAASVPAPPPPVQLGRLRVRLAKAASWTLALSDKAAASELRGYSLVVVDGETTSTSRIRTLHARGSIVLAYLSIGTIEDGRWWSTAAQEFRLDRWQDWGEWYADVNRPRFRSLITGTVLPRIMAAGYDGVFLDNVDMVESHPAQRRGMATLLSQVSRQVHGRGRLVLAQNGDTQLSWMLPWLDGWNREDVSYTYDFDTGKYRRASAAERGRAARAIGRVTALRRPAFTTDYLSNPASPTAAPQVADAVRYSCRLGAKPYVSSILLDRMPSRPLHC